MPSIHKHLCRHNISGERRRGDAGLAGAMNIVVTLTDLRSASCLGACSEAILKKIFADGAYPMVDQSSI